MRDPLIENVGSVYLFAENIEQFITPMRTSGVDDLH